MRLLPRIGLSTYQEEASWGVWSRSAAVVPWTYVEAINAVGGHPVLLPPGRSAETAIAGVDALVLIGGPDLPVSDDPGHDRGPTPRDTWEAALLAEALRVDLPVLGICRGMQLMNVALGGSLFQHLPDVVGSDQHQVGVGVVGVHDVSLAQDTWLHGRLGAMASVPTYHHQGVDELGRDVLPVAFASDGLVEAIEIHGPSFALGVQWHPEEGADLTVFHLLLDAVANRQEDAHVNH